ncbi:conserved membrane hypothetical protein [Pseudomonas sp. 8Z]|uniref:hypothetical protein n=1 Tax=Pseudomonas sp. 8Z TaxID=2653166 RepID=UPI0012F41709|nr:hypothetical protein [Pseudomonas sp. 8Z]VXC94878.1 conserved membrane hypothetical protein [Pseudomonas sp. 8Z]
MNSFSTLVLVWLFGTWMFDQSELIGIGSTHTTVVTPLTIFASYFSIVGLAGFGILASWAMFLGIFRLRQNGNFFGSRDGNEAFFYPLRVVVALTLCAPVIPVASAGGQSVVLTPGHSLIAGIAKNGSKWGDDAQTSSFKLMHAYNLFHEPNYEVSVNRPEAKGMIVNWLQLATVATGYYIHKNPTNALKDITATQLAVMLAEGAWRRQYTDSSKPGYYGASSTTAPFINQILNHTAIPLIPPTDAIAAAIKHSDSSIPKDAGEDTVGREMDSENFLCKGSGTSGFAASIVCSDEQMALRVTNDKSISQGLAAAQRQMWQRIVQAQFSRHMGFKNNQNAEEANALAAASKTYLEKEVDWYIANAQFTIRTAIASQLLAESEQFFASLEEWGWMMGGTFVLRAANDFTKAQSYASEGTSKLYPTSDLADLTFGDDLTKLTMNKVERELEDSGDSTDLADLLGLDILGKDPSQANLYTVSAFGRELAGTGLMFISGSGLSWIASKATKGNGGMTKALFMIGVVLLIAGAMIGYVLPVVFAIFGLMGVISWLTFVASAFFGVTLWSAAQAAPKGEEHTSQMAGKGWNTLIFIGFYPALAVGGLAAAVTITSIGLPIVNTMMAGLWGMMDNGAADLSQPFDAIAGLLIGSIMMVLLTCMLFWSVCMTSASLITNFPRTVLNMISFSEPGLNPYENTAQGVMGGVSGLVKAPLSIATQSIVRRIVQPGGPRSPQGGGE